MKKDSISAFSGVGLALFLVKIFPAVEKSLSHGTLVAMIPTYFSASLDDSVSLFSSTFHQANESDLFVQWI